MDIIYVRYIPKDTRAALVELGSRDGKICGLVADKVPDHEREKIRDARTMLDAISVERKIGWLREHCPVAYRSAYREMRHINAQILSRHSMQS